MEAKVHRLLAKARRRTAWFLGVRTFLGGIFWVFWVILTGIIYGWPDTETPWWVPVVSVGLLGGIALQFMLFVGPWWRGDDGGRMLRRLSSAILLVDSALILACLWMVAWTFFVALGWLVWVGLAIDQRRWIRIATRDLVHPRAIRV